MSTDLTYISVACVVIIAFWIGRYIGYREGLKDGFR